MGISHLKFSKRIIFYTEKCYTKLHVLLHISLCKELPFSAYQVIRPVFLLPPNYISSSDVINDLIYSTCMALKKYKN